jgi:hypothetical protein
VRIDYVPADGSIQLAFSKILLHLFFTDFSSRSPFVSPLEEEGPAASQPENLAAERFH